jgi:hypothetical protein
MTKTRMLCPNCGSDNVNRDGSFRWDVIAQAWVATGDFEPGFVCNDCCTELADCDETTLMKLEGPCFPREVWVRCYIADRANGEPITLAEFFEANRDGIDADEQNAIIDALRLDGTYLGGGGAAAEWRLWVVADPAN